MKSLKFPELKLKKVHMGCLEKGTDLLTELTNFVINNEIMAGMIWGIGALTKAKIFHYDFDEKKYHELIFTESFELLNLTGNISLKDDVPFVHAHITLADRHGHAFGGHLTTENEVFAFEFTILELTGSKPIRHFDKETGLYLWKHTK